VVDPALTDELRITPLIAQVEPQDSGGQLIA
jgi:hypothetical protein